MNAKNKKDKNKDSKSTDKNRDASREKKRERMYWASMTKILTARMEAHPTDSNTLARYEETGGYKALRKALADMAPEAIAAEVKASGIRGRGGARSEWRASRWRVCAG